MSKLIIIGSKKFNFKKDAIRHFRKILNSYDYDETLNQNDFNNVYELLKNHHKAKEKIGTGINKIKVKKLKYDKKGFYLIRKDSTTDFFSYLKCINGQNSLITKFRNTCREIVKNDIYKVKFSYFKNNSKKGKVKCQETNKLCCWEELTIDHRQPNTFSVIVDRFIELNKVDINNIEYIETEIYGYKFVNETFSEKFRNYHKEKANLRIVKKELNLGRAYQARIKKQKKDLSIN